MRVAMSQLNLSARAYHRILKLTRTIADLAGSEDIQSAHLAVSHRSPTAVPWSFPNWMCNSVPCWESRRYSCSRIP